MARAHLFEFNDQAWLPDAWRRYITEYLQFMLEHGPFDELPSLVAQTWDGEDDVRVVDLCSGSGGPWPAYLEDPLTPFDDVDVLLTDLQPEPDTFQRIQERTDGRAIGYDDSIDATDVPPQLEGPRTVINGFHHFKPQGARAILADAVDRGERIGVFEIMERRAAAILPLVLIPLFVFLLTPLVRPLRLGRFVWTYLLPVIPLMIFWDGLVSALRVYSPDELRELVADYDGYEWDIGTAPVSKGPQRITYLIGKPGE